MDFKKFDKICVLILAIIIILQGLLLIFGWNHPVYFVPLGLGDFLSILFWIILAFNIGAIVDNKYCK